MGYFQLDKSFEENKDLYRTLSKVFHPDRPGGNQAKFQDLLSQWEKYDKIHKKIEKLDPKQKQKLDSLLDRLKDLQEKGKQVSDKDKGWNILSGMMDPAINNLEKHLPPFLRTLSRSVMNEYQVEAKEVLKGIYQIIKP